MICMISRRQFGSLTLAAAAAMASQKTAAQSPKRRIVDAQVHLWKAESEDWKWVPGMKPQMPEPFTLDKLIPLMDQARVDRVVVVPPSWPGDRNDYALEAAKRYPDRLAVMGRIALKNPQAAALLPKMERAARDARHTGDLPRPGPDLAIGRHGRLVLAGS
jgi:predicted TIM-barrel fold metal-dependent hydrolase